MILKKSVMIRYIESIFRVCLFIQGEVEVVETLDAARARGQLFVSQRLTQRSVKGVENPAVSD